MARIFEGLDPKLQGKSILDGAERIEQAAASSKESDRWSIAELRLSGDDVAWLRTWAASLLPDQTVLNLQYSTRSPKFGLLFLALAAEICRRESDESEAWPVIRMIGWNGGVKSVLFNKQGAAKPLLCHAIEGACLQYGLRNILGQQEKQYWFTTIKLQFGLTHSGITSQLVHWLYLDTLPSVAQVLLEDPENYSASFAMLIEALKAHQGKFVHEGEMRRLLEASPWVLNDWIGEVLAAVLRKPAYEQSRWEPLPRLPAPIADDAGDTRVCAGETALAWHDGAPQFIASISDEVDERCGTDRFFVSVDGAPQALFIKQSDGGFARAGQQSRAIAFSVTSPSACITVTDSSSEPVAIELVQLYDPDADLEAWEHGSDGRGHLFDLEERILQGSRSYSLRIPSDAVIEPSDVISNEWCIDAHKWVHLAPHWPGNLRIMLDEVDLFAGVNQFHESATEPKWTSSISAQLTDVDWEREEFSLLISSTQEVRIMGARVLGKAVPLNRVDLRTIKSAPVAMEIHDVRGTIEIRIAAESGGERRIIRRKERLPLDGLWFNHGGSWRRHRPERDLNVGELRRGTCLVHPPMSSGTERHPWVTLQGYREVGVPVKRPGQLHDLAGWGQGLELAQGRYNRPVNDPRVVLALRVVDRGCLRDCLQISTANSLIIRLQDPIEPSDEHRIIAWTTEGHLVEIGGDDIRSVSDAATWYVDRSSCTFENAGRFIAVAVAYRNKRLGAWWTEDWCRAALKHCRGGRAKEAAQLLRWFQLPVLDPRYAGAVRAIVEEHGLEFAKAWLLWRDLGYTPARVVSERIDADELRPPTADPAWFEVVQTMFADWKPRLEDAEQLISDFERDAVELNERLSALPMANLVDRVAQVSPLLTGRLAREWLSDKHDYAHQVRPLLSALAEQIRRNTSSEAETRDRAEADVCDDFDPRVKDLRLSHPFVDDLLNTARCQCVGATVEPHSAENLQRLLQHQTFRKLVAAHLLETLTPPDRSDHVTA